MTYDRFTSRAHRRLRLRFFMATVAALLIGAALAVFVSLHLEFSTHLLKSQVAQLLVPPKIRNKFFLEENSTSLPDFQKNAQMGVLEQRDKKGNLLPWTFHSDKNTLERKEAIHQILSRVKSKDEVLLFNDNSGLSLLRTSPLKSDTVWFSRKVIVLLPGESLEIKLGSSAARNEVPSALFAKCLGATPDRKDAPGKFKVSVNAQAPLELEISPLGSTERLEIPSASSLLGEQTISLNWPQDAPGLLVFEGFERASREQETNSPGVFFVTVDSLKSFESLPLTMAALSEKYAPRNVMQWNNVLSLSEDHFYNLVSLFAEKKPADAGLLFPEDSITARRPLDSVLEAHFANANYATHRIQVGNHVPCERSRCLTPGNPEYSAGISHFGTLIEYAKPGNISASRQQIFQQPIQLANSFVHLNIQLDERDVDLTWSSANESQTSLFKWVWAGFKTRFGLVDRAKMSNPVVLALQAEEKTRQIDAVLSRLVLNLNSKSPPHLMILLGRKAENLNESEQNDFMELGHIAEQERGAVLLASPALSAAVGQHAEKIQGALHSQLSIGPTLTSLANLSLPQANDHENLVERSSESSVLWAPQLQEAELTSSQSTHFQLLVFPYGWIFNPSETSGKTPARVLPIEKEHLSVEKTLQFLKESDLHLVHFWFPVKKNRDGAVARTRALELTTNHAVQGCFSSQMQTHFTGTVAGVKQNATNNPTQTISADTVSDSDKPWHVACVLSEKVRTGTFVTVKAFENSLPIERPFLGVGSFSLPPPPQSELSTGEFKFNSEDLVLTLVSNSQPFFDAFAQTKAFFWKDTYAHLGEESLTWFPLFVQDQAADPKTFEARHGPTASP